jgi:hypothetical protein
MLAWRSSLLAPSPSWEMPANRVLANGDNLLLQRSMQMLDSKDKGIARSSFRAKSADRALEITD